MNIDSRIWGVAIEAIDAEREARFQRLLSGNCDSGEYRQICGFLSGLFFFEQALKEARKPKTTEKDNAPYNYE